MLDGGSRVSWVGEWSVVRGGVATDNSGQGRMSAENSAEATSDWRCPGGSVACSSEFEKAFVVRAQFLDGLRRESGNGTWEAIALHSRARLCLAPVAWKFLDCSDGLRVG